MRCACALLFLLCGSCMVGVDSAAAPILAAAFGGMMAVNMIIDGFDFENEIKNDNYLNVGLAPSFGTLDKESVKMMDDELKVMIAGVTRAIAKLDPNSRSWDNVISLLNQNSLIQQVADSEITRSDKLIKDGTNYFKFDGSADLDTVREVETWFTNFVNDADILDSTGIDIDVLAKIVAATGVAVDGLSSVFYDQAYEERNVLEIGVLRYPDIDHPYFKVYRLKLVAWAESKRYVFVQEDSNGITGELRVVKYEPRPSVMERLSEKIIGQAVDEAEALFG
eukprot:TRINITY_DN304_c0_g1_i1.p1 TRINITY_DN304_c0_g1~~TRINITY_DN304_c0_g1_i1.p1  ORF type:complete len:280 (-),score=70.01 TRINITY_DN304_c0_g1_i1:445-1284(-)